MWNRQRKEKTFQKLTFDKKHLKRRQNETQDDNFCHIYTFTHIYVFFFSLVVSYVLTISLLPSASLTQNSLQIPFHHIKMPSSCLSLLQQKGTVLSG